MAYYPDNLPNFLGNDPSKVAAWVFEELQRVSEELNRDDLLRLRPIASMPSKYSEGTLVCFAAGTDLDGYEVPETSYWAFLSGEWKRLAIVED